MTDRSIRRAAERKARKEARRAANQANAQLSKGPKTAEGKAKSSVNAVKTALTGRTVLLPTDDLVEYERHLAAYTEEFTPTGLLESNLVQSIADTDWRLCRIPALESALFAKGRIEFAELFNEQDLSARPYLIDAHTFLTYEKQIRNLQLQEARLARRREKEIAELRKLQADRTERLAPAVQGEEPRIQKQPQEIPANGFVFSTPPIEPTTLRRTAIREHAPLANASGSYLLTPVS